MLRLKSIVVKLFTDSLEVPEVYALELRKELNPELEPEEPEPAEWVPEEVSFRVPMGITVRAVYTAYLEFRDGDIHLSLWHDGTGHLCSHPYLNGVRFDYSRFGMKTGYGIRINGWHVFTVRPNSVRVFPIALRHVVRELKEAHSVL